MTTTLASHTDHWLDQVIRALGGIARITDMVETLHAPGHCPGCIIAVLEQNDAREEDTRRAWKRMPAAAAAIAAVQARRRAEWDAADTRLEAHARGEDVPEYAPVHVEPW